MAAVAFDTAKFVDELEAVKVPREQARVIVDLMRSSHEVADVATKGDLSAVEQRLDGKIELLHKDLTNLEQRMDTRFVEMRGEQALLKWMLVTLIAGTIALLIRAFT